MDHRFSNNKLCKNVKTVGQMIEELSRLPSDLRVAQGFSGSGDLVVFNPSHEDRHLQLEEGGSWDTECDPESEDL
jgi:hypothetical protein